MLAFRARVMGFVWLHPTPAIVGLLMARCDWTTRVHARASWGLCRVEESVMKPYTAPCESLLQSGLDSLVTSQRSQELLDLNALPVRSFLLTHHCTH
jgi:hypothetical protein